MPLRFKYNMVNRCCLNEAESKHKWMQIFDEIRARVLEDIFFISMDCVSGLEEGARAIFLKVTVQRCMVEKSSTQRMRLRVIHSSFRKVTKKGAFPNENVLLKVLYLRVKELEKNGTVAMFNNGLW